MRLTENRKQFLATVVATGAALTVAHGQVEAAEVSPPGGHANTNASRIARFFCSDEISDILILPGGKVMNLESAFMQAGIYSIKGVSYDCRRQGLYRFLDRSQPYLTNRIVWAPGMHFDIYALMSAISWNHVHGTQGERVDSQSNTDYQAISNDGIRRKWVVRCGFIAGLLPWLLPQLKKHGVQLNSRIRSVITTETVNHYDDGHVIVETLHGTDWRMWDLTNGCYFRDDMGKHMSTAAFITQIAYGGEFPKKVLLSYANKYSHDMVQKLDVGLYCQLVLGSPALTEAWYRRIFQKLVK